MGRQSAYAKRRRNKGLCGWGGCEALSGDEYYCIHHAVKRAMGRRARKNFLREQKAALSAARTGIPVNVVDLTVVK